MSLNKCAKKSFLTLHSRIYLFICLYLYLLIHLVIRHKTTPYKYITKIQVFYDVKPCIIFSNLMCGNKMPTRCNRGFYCRSYCLLMCPVCRMLQHPANRTHNPQLHTRPQLENHSTKYHRQQPLYNILELLMMGIVVPETC